MTNLSSVSDFTSRINQILDFSCRNCSSLPREKMEVADRSGAKRTQRLLREANVSEAQKRCVLMQLRVFTGARWEGRHQNRPFFEWRTFFGLGFSCASSGR
jgi:hypothetical protein